MHEIIKNRGVKSTIDGPKNDDDFQKKPSIQEKKRLLIFSCMRKLRWHEGLTSASCYHVGKYEVS